MAKGDFGLKDPKSKVKPVLGFTDAETVKLDLDDKSFKSAKYWALKAMKRFRLDGFIILRSSKKHYHVVFDRHVSWEDNLSVVGWVAVLPRSVAMFRWLAMQCIKKSSTLRVIPTGDKPSPRVVHRCGKQDHQIRNFLKHRKLIKKIYHSIH